jgi:hypothetical protein
MVHPLWLESGLWSAAALLAAKAFWLASGDGTWWPYVVIGVVYNLAVAWPLFRHFMATNARD